MKSMLEQIYLGTKGNCEVIPETKEYYKLNHISCTKMDEFVKKLSKENAREFNEIVNAEADVQAETLFAHFKEGFKIGLFLGLELREEEEQ